MGPKRAFTPPKSNYHALILGMTLLVWNRTQVVELLVKCCNRSTMLQG